MRQWFVFCLLAGILVFPLAACHASGLRIGVAWQGQADMQTRVSQGLEDALAHMAPQIDIEWQRELPDMEALASVVKRFEQEKDAMVLLRSSGAQFLANNPPSIPAFIGGCSHPVLLGVVQNMEAPEGVITGVSYALDYSRQMKTFAAIIPQMQSILLLYDSHHPSSPIDRNGMQLACKQNRISYFEAGCSSREDVIAAASQWKNRVSAIILGNQALVFDRAGPVVQAAGMTPVLAFQTDPVNQGALCGLSANDVKLGRMLGQSIVDVLVNGKAIRETPIKTDPRPNLCVNLTTAERIGIIIPLAVLKTAQIIW